MNGAGTGADPAKIFMGAEKCRWADHALLQATPLNTGDEKRSYYSKNSPVY